MGFVLNGLGNGGREDTQAWVILVICLREVQEIGLRTRPPERSGGSAALLKTEGGEKTAPVPQGKKTELSIFLIELGIFRSSGLNTRGTV